MKAFASDLDGTLVHNKKVKDSDRKAIQDFQKRIYLGSVQEDLYVVYLI